MSKNVDPDLNKVIKKYIGVSLFQSGSYYDDKDEFAKSMNYYTRALSLWNELLSDKSQTTDDLKIKSYKANTLGNIGIVYRRQGNYPNALDYYLQALKMDEETGVKKEIATDLGNIGIVYYKLKDYPKTLRFYYRALTLDKEIGNLNGVARHLGNIGSVYAETKDYAKALENFMQALILAERLDNKGGIARHLSNIGSVYHMMSDYSKALEYYSRALVIKKQLGSKTLMASGTRSIGTLYTATNNFALAEQLLLQSFQFATEAGSPDELKETYKSLSELYKKTGQHAKALYNYERSVAIADSLYNSEKDKEITRKELTYEFDKKESLLKAEHEKEKVIAELNKKKQNIILLFVSIGLLLVFIFSAFVFKALKVTRRQKQLIEEKSRQTEEQKKIIEHQRDIVEQKNKDIIDSINYAKRIQEALLKEEEYVTEHLPEHFILFKPKDIVSGDFYWALEKEEHFYIAAVDCTGHGVPGAFMSMLGVAFLNEITSASRILSPAEILEELRHKIVKELGQSGKDHESKDGMDMSLVRLNLKTNELQWAGANNPLYIISDGKLQELKPDKQCIGFEHDMQPFKNHNLTLAKASSFYLFTDGYADQFGGNKGKKFKNNQLKDLLIDLNDKSLEVQKNILDQTFIDWKGNLEQVDDVCIVGVKV